MTTDPLAVPTALAVRVSFLPDEMALVRHQAAANGLSVSEFIRDLVRQALAMERVERSDGAEMAAVKAESAVVRRRG